MHSTRPSATDEVATIRKIATHFPKEHNNVRIGYELGALYILYKAIRNVFKR